MPRELHRLSAGGHRLIVDRDEGGYVGYSVVVPGPPDDSVQASGRVRAPEGDRGAARRVLTALAHYPGVRSGLDTETVA